MAVSPYRTRTYPVPATRDPIINTPLLSLGNRAGPEQFWISTYNRCTGSTGLRVDEWGRCRAYQFPWQHEGFYSSAYVGGNTLWLCGRLDRVVRLNLRSGRFTAFETGVSKGRVFEGMIHDPATGKLLIVSEPYHGQRSRQPPVAVSFDTRRRRTAARHQLQVQEGLSRFSFPNGDGTYTMVLQIPGESLIRWDPRTERVSPQTLRRQPVWSQDGAEKKTCRLVSDERGRWYLPGYGWYDPQQRTFAAPSPEPALEMAWFARRGRQVFGALNQGDDIILHTWDLDTGRVNAIGTIPDCDVFNVSLARSGSLVAVNVCGVFFRLDPETGAPATTCRLPTDGFADALVVCRADGDRLIGAPYISSRFWQLDLRSGDGQDCGRCQPGWGQIAAMQNVRGKVYMAAYAGGELMEYDPARPPCYPDNPRLVADPPNGMRPVAIANDGRHVYYACSRDYGALGSVLARYDTITGRTLYADCPVPEQRITSLLYSRKSRSLICATTFHADSMDCEPTQDICRVAEIDAATFELRQSAMAPEGFAMATAAGPLDADRWLCFLHGSVSGPPEKWMVLHRSGFRDFARGEQALFPAAFSGACAYAGRPGLFVLNIDDGLELWDMRCGKVLGVLFQPFDVARFDGYLFTVQAESLIVLRTREVIVIDNWNQRRRTPR